MRNFKQTSVFIKLNPIQTTSVFKNHASYINQKSKFIITNYE